MVDILVPISSLGFSGVGSVNTWRSRLLSPDDVPVTRPENAPIANDFDGGMSR